MVFAKEEMLELAHAIALVERHGFSVVAPADTPPVVRTQPRMTVTPFEPPTSPHKSEERPPTSLSETEPASQELAFSRGASSVSESAEAQIQAQIQRELDERVRALPEHHGHYVDPKPIERKRELAGPRIVIPVS